MARSLWWALRSCPSYNPAVMGFESSSSFRPLEKKVKVGVLLSDSKAGIIMLRNKPRLEEMLLTTSGPETQQENKMQGRLVPRDSLLSASPTGSRVL